MRVLISNLVCLAILTACSGLLGKPTATPEANQDAQTGAIVSATGVVLPEQFTTLSLPKAGMVEQVLVVDGQAVAEYDVLVRMRGEKDLQAALSAARLELSTAQQAYDLLFKDPEVRSTEAQQAVVEAQKAVKDARQKVDNLGKPPRKTDIDVARANVAMAKIKLTRIQDEFHPYKNRPEDNLKRAMMLSKLAQAQKEYDAVLRYLNNLLGNPSQFDINKAQAELESAQAKLTAAVRKLETLKKGPNPVDVKVVEDRINNARTQLAAAENGLADLELLAPFSGTISEVYVHANEWVDPGKAVLLLADLEHLCIETTDLSEIAVARIQMQDPVSVTFDALPGVVMAGQVTRIAPKSTQGAGVNYKVIISIDDTPPELRWGMTAFVDIKVER